MFWVVFWRLILSFPWRIYIFSLTYIYIYIFSGHFPWRIYIYIFSVPFPWRIYIFPVYFPWRIYIFSVQFPWRIYIYIFSVHFWEVVSLIASLCVFVYCIDSYAFTSFFGLDILLNGLRVRRKLRKRFWFCA